MLDAACPGQVFTSPAPDQIIEACRSVAGIGGVLNIVKNYTGDVMNFQMAADLLREEGVAVRNVIIDDDVAVKDSTFTAGRRGLGTTVIAEKICGAAAERGYDLESLTGLCKQVNINGKSMGMALTSCITPQNATPSFTLADDEMEIGIGIHGEPGVERMKMKPADEITEVLTNAILEDGAYTRDLSEWDTSKNDWVDVEVVDARFDRGDRAIVVVNSMGGTPLGELYTVYKKVREIAERKGITIVRKLIGYYITSMEMQGVSITMVKADDTMIDLFDAPVHTPGLRWGI
jgi:dihydroxyacetone kinase-like protein